MRYGTQVPRIVYGTHAPNKPHDANSIIIILWALLGHEMGAPAVRVGLFTHNISGLFDGDDSVFAGWAANLHRLVEQQQLDFIAVHLQEVGGSKWRDEGVSRATTVVAAVITEFGDFWCSGMLLNPDTANDFTALGSFFIVRRSAVTSVQAWQFANGGGGGGSWRTLDGPLCGPQVLEPALPAASCRHGRFPQDFFPEMPTWSRKGYLHTRWLVGGKEIDLVNVHLFHDDNNLTALQRAYGESVSLYAAHRRDALRHVLNGVVGSRPVANPSPLQQRLLYVFGDFNFRLDQRGVLEHLCGPAGGCRRAHPHARQRTHPHACQYATVRTRASGTSRTPTQTAAHLPQLHTYPSRAPTPAAHLPQPHTYPSCTHLPSAPYLGEPLAAALPPMAPLSPALPRLCHPPRRSHPPRLCLSPVTVVAEAAAASGADPALHLQCIAGAASAAGAVDGLSVELGPKRFSLSRPELTAALVTSQREPLRSMDVEPKALAQPWQPTGTPAAVHTSAPPPAPAALAETQL